MAEEFLRNLAQVGEADLPKDSECGICQEKYGNVDSHPGAMDNPIRLPCQHVIGSDCIRRWVSPSEHGKNTCPFCRYIFFSSYQDFEDSLYREMEEWYRATIQPPGMTDEDRQVARHSLRTNERLLYEELQIRGSQLPALNEHGTLNAEQVSALFEELVRIEAFGGLVGSFLDNWIEWDDWIVWELLRRDGFVYVLHDPAMGSLSGWRTMGRTPDSWFVVPSDEYAWPDGSGSLVVDPLV